MGPLFAWFFRKIVFKYTHLIQRSAKRRGCLLSCSQAEPGRELTQPIPRLLAELCTINLKGLHLTAIKVISHPRVRRKSFPTWYCNVQSCRMEGGRVTEAVTHSSVLHSRRRPRRPQLCQGGRDRQAHPGRRQHEAAQANHNLHILPTSSSSLQLGLSERQNHPQPQIFLLFLGVQPA